jgi:hypothetical protein
VEAAVSVIVCSMSVIIPAILRALNVGDPFMQEDTVDPGLSTGVEIVRGTLTRVELGLPSTHTPTIAGGERLISVITPQRRRDSGGLDEKRGEKHLLMTQISDGSLGTSPSECDITDSRALQVRSLPVFAGDTETEGEGGDAKRKST